MMGLRCIFTGHVWEYRGKEQRKPHNTTFTVYYLRKCERCGRGDKLEDVSLEGESMYVEIPKESFTHLWSMEDNES